MNTDTRQIAKIHHRLDTMRRVLNQSLDEIQAQLDAMGGGGDIEGAGEWKVKLSALITEESKKGRDNARKKNFKSRA